MITAPLGATLIAFPGAAGVAGMGARTTRVIGVTDLALAVGLLAGRPRWPWAAARAVANVPTAVACWRTGSPVGLIMAVALAGMTVVDAATAKALRTSSR